MEKTSHQHKPPTSAVNQGASPTAASATSGNAAVAAPRTPSASHPSGPAAPSSPALSRSHKLALLVTFYVGAFVAAFNENLVNTALVQIMAELSIDTATAQWLVTGYMVVTATMVTLMGWAYNRFDTRKMFVFALAVFALGEVGGMLAPSFAILLVARLIQALGTGMLIPIMMSSVLALAPHGRMGTFLSIGTCMITFGPAFAPVVSGAITTYVGWRFVFVPPLVVAVVLLILGIALGRNLGPMQKAPVDALSIVLSAATLFALAFGLGQLTSNTALGVGCVVAGVVLGALFALRQLKLKTPLLDVSLLKSSRFWPGTILSMIGMMMSFSMSVLLPLYFEGSLGTTAFVAGCLLLIPILLNAAATLFAGRVMDGFGCWPLLPIGFLLIVVGQMVVALTGSTMSLVGVLAASVITYVGVGCTMSPSQTAGLSSLTSAQHADGVALVNTFVQIAACIGPALFTGVLSSGTAAALASGASAAAANAAGFSQAVWVAAGIAVVGCALSFVYARKVRRRRSAAQ